MAPRRLRCDLTPAVCVGRLMDLVIAYLTDVARRGLSPATVTAYRRPLEEFVRALAERRVTRLAHVRESHLAAWALRVKSGNTRRRSWPRRTLQPATIRMYLSIVQRFFAWLVRQGVLLASPARVIGLRDIPNDPIARLTVPSEAQMRTLLDEAPRERLVELRDRAAFELVYAAGLRMGEVRQLDLCDIDLDHRLVRVRRGKGGKDRVVPIGEPAHDALIDWLTVGRPHLARDRSAQAAFVTARGDRLGRATLRSRLHDLQRRLGLPAFRVHDLRHASALHMLRHGADLRHLQEMLGHATLKPTQVYTRLEPADLKAVHRQAHPRGRGTMR